MTSKLAILQVPVLVAVLGAALAAQSIAPNPSPSGGAARPGLFDRVILNERKSEDAMEVYERIERLEVRKNPGDAKPSSLKIARVIPSGTGMTHIAVGEDGIPVDAFAYRSDLERLAKALELIAADSRSQREPLEKYAKKRRERNELIESTRNAFLFTFVAREPRSDRMLAKYTMEHNPAFKPTTRFSAVFTKVRGFIWIDEESGELARIEGDVIEDISIALFLGKIYKGSHFMQERYEFRPGLWLNSFSQYDFDGRKFFSSFSIHERTLYSNYRYIGPPKEAVVAIRKELGRADLGKSASAPADR